ncbi:branched-chain amino acid transport system substrate-binding protein [Rhizobium aquaticum]|uniref:Branched-chain amino acid transport system substrate-binding protein n=1 Tax=Rhizobium aquaticum TaxID=1549636 RepID=A0ABV2J680_9HYPH
MKLLLSKACIAGAALALSLGVAAGSLHAEEKKPFVIGAIFSKTGAYAGVGGLLEAALTTAVNEVNEKGGILGRPVKIEVRDDGSNPGRALLAARELVGDGKIDVMYPDAISGLVLAILPYTSSEKIITVTNAGAPAVGDATKFPYSFQYGDTANARADALAVAIKKDGGKKVGILVNTNPAIIATADEFEKQAKALGMEVVGYEKFGAEVKDLSAQLQSLRAAGADRLFFGGPAQNNLRVAMVGLQTLNWKVPLFTDLSSITNLNMATELPETTHDQLHVLTVAAATRVNGKVDPQVGQFVTRLDNKRALDPAAVNTRDVVYLMKWAYETAQAKSGNTNPDTVRAVLEKAGTPGYELKDILIYKHPNYTTERHTTSEADYTHVWGLMGVNEAKDGMYASTPFVADAK